jgi:hypothetical protein
MIMKKLVVTCDRAFVDRLDCAVAAAGTSRAKFVRAVLAAAADAVFEREKLFEAFEAYYVQSGLRARAQIESDLT